jgi:hypothetical protein
MLLKISVNFQIFIIIVCLQNFANTGCDKKLLCMACSTTASDHCEACFNWVGGKNEDRFPMALDTAK